MSKIIILCLFAFLITSLSQPTTSTDLQCAFYMSHQYVTGQVYQCQVAVDPFIKTHDSAQISSVTGRHYHSESNDDVIGFRADNKTIEYFPRGLEKFFKNLQLIEIYYCPIKEIYQADLKSLTNLTYLNIYESDIEVLEQGLFDFNTELIVLGINGNKLIHIDSNVLDNLPKLMHFWFGFVPCFQENISNSRDRINSGIQKVKSQCTNAEFIIWDQKVKNLENELKLTTFENFGEKIENFEKGFKYSKFSKFRPLKNKIEVLKSNLKCSSCAQTEKIFGLEKKVDGLDNKVTMAVNNIIVELAERFDRNQKEMISRLHVMSTNFDEKIQAVEKRMAKKFEEILEEKLVKILEEKLGGA